VDEYEAAVERLTKPFENVRMTVDWSDSTTKPDGQTSNSSLVVHLVRSGEYYILRLDSPSGFGQVDLAHPRQSVMATRDGPNAPWVVEDDPKYDAQRLYRRVLRNIVNHWFSELTVLSLTSAFAGRGELSGLVVEHFERFTEEGRRYVRVRLNEGVPNESGKARLLTFILSVDDLYTVRSTQVEEGDLSSRATFDHEVRDGIPMLTAHHAWVTRNDGTRTTLQSKVTERRFEATPESDFTSERLLDGAVVRKVVSGASRVEGPATIWGWYWIPLVLGASAPAGGAGIAVVRSRSRRLDSTSACSSPTR
jgi:hypothetical protein